MNPYNFSNKWHSTHNVIRRALGSNKTILDVGCNDGYLGKDDKRGNIFYGLDLSESCVRTAKNYYVDVRTTNLNTCDPLPWQTRFDVIIFADILEHLNQPEDVLKFYSAHYLHKNGFIIISLPNVANWKIRLALLFGQFTYTDSGILDRTHLHLYTFKTAKALVQECGLKTETIDFGASILRPLIKVLPFLKGLLSTNIILFVKNEI